MRWRKQTAAIKGSLVFQEPMAQELLHHFYTVSTSDNTNIYTLWCLQDIRRRKIPDLSNVAPPVKGVQLWGVKYNARKVWKARTPQSLSCVGAPQSFSCVLCGCTAPLGLRAHWGRPLVWWHKHGFFRAPGPSSIWELHWGIPYTHQQRATPLSRCNTQLAHTDKQCNKNAFEHSLWESVSLINFFFLYFWFTLWRQNQ